MKRKKKCLIYSLKHQSHLHLRAQLSWSLLANTQTRLSQKHTFIIGIGRGAHTGGLPAGAWLHSAHTQTSTSHEVCLSDRLIIRIAADVVVYEDWVRRGEVNTDADRGKQRQQLPAVGLSLVLIVSFDFVFAFRSTVWIVFRKKMCLNSSKKSVSFCSLVTEEAASMGPKTSTQTF